MFEEIAKYYDIVMEDFDYQDLVDYLDDLIMANDGERTNILDLGCGTAEELVYFRQLGYKVTGLDNSENMLKFAEEKHPGVDFTLRDMSNFKFRKKFDNVICTFDSINYLTESKSVKKCFSSVYETLNDKGIFLFDFNTVYGLIKEWEGIKTEESTDYTIIYDSKFDYDKLINTTRMKFFIKEEKKEEDKFDKYISFEEIHQERGYTKDEMKLFLKKAGFSKIKIYPFLKKNASKSSNFDRYQVIAVK